MKRTQLRIVAAAVLTPVLLAQPGQADPAVPSNLLELQVETPGGDCLQTGAQIEVVLRISNLSEAVVGYQAFLQFDPQVLSFVSGEYVLPDPFGLPLITPIQATSGSIDLSAGVNPLAGQQATQTDADLAVLTFQAIGPVDTTRVRFRPHNPPTTLTTTTGGILPALQATTRIISRDCPTCLLVDFDCDADVDYADAASFVECINGPEVPTPPPGCDPQSFALADLEVDDDVDLRDFSIFQRGFTGAL